LSPGSDNDGDDAEDKDGDESESEGRQPDDIDFPHDRGPRASDRASGDGKVGGDGHIAGGFTEGDIPF
jgi:hypothetical protein